MYGFLSEKQIVKETEKAYQFNVEIETWKGSIINWNLWLPKSVFQKLDQIVCADGSTAYEINSFCNKLWDGKLPSGAKEIR